MPSSLNLDFRADSQEYVAACPIKRVNERVGMGPILFVFPPRPSREEGADWERTAEGRSPARPGHEKVCLTRLTRRFALRLFHPLFRSGRDSGIFIGADLGVRPSHQGDAIPVSLYGGCRVEVPGWRAVPPHLLLNRRGVPPQSEITLSRPYSLFRFGVSKAANAISSTRFCSLKMVPPNPPCPRPPIARRSIGVEHGQSASREQ